MTALPSPAGGVLDDAVHRYALRVYYEDTDAGGVVYHANYLRWFERARSDLLELLGIDQAGAAAAGEGAYVVTEANLRYLAPARLGDTVMLETRAATLGASTSTLLQTAWRGETRLVEGLVRVTFVDSDGRPRRQPAAWRQAFAAFAASSPEGQE
jgi:acyl-CoA thioester hydrolase